MRLSIVIPAYNVEAHIERAIRSAIAAAPPESEIVVVDDGSSDSTFAAVERMADRAPVPLRLTAHPDGRNHGPGATRNRGAELAAGELIAFLDADDEYLPHRFAADVPLLEREPAADAVCGSTRIVSETDADPRPPLELPADTLPERVLEALLRERFWHADAFTVRRSLWDRAGGFPTHLRMAEDCQLWFRMAILGRIVPSPERRPVAVYRRRSGSAHVAGWESKGWLLRALSETASWTRATGQSRAVRRAVCVAARRYFVQAASDALAERRPDVARDYLAIAARDLGWRLWLDRRAARRIVSIWRSGVSAARTRNIPADAPNEKRHE